MNLGATEKGVLDRMVVAWTGPPITYSGVVERTILSPGQTFLVFLLLGSLLMISLFFLALELFYYKLKPDYNMQSFKTVQATTAVPTIHEEFYS
jgi:hypothetical protein